jgi:8-oxo-dGTP pyrophosphatase MutT (NUDIX family)
MSRPRRLIRTVFTFLHGLRRIAWKVTGPGLPGVHALPLTREGRVVLVLLTYAPGWRLPGGGRRRSEAPETAMLRELREEIGLVAHGAMERLDDFRPPALPGDRSAFFVVRDVVYRPRRSLEIEEVREFDPDRLPGDTAPWTARIVERFAGLRSPPAPPASG